MRNLTLIAISIFTRCKKDNVTNTNKLSLTEFIQKFSVVALSFNGVAGMAFNVAGVKVIKIDFPSNKFFLASGNPVTGNIKLSLEK